MLKRSILFILVASILLRTIVAIASEEEQKSVNGSQDNQVQSSDQSGNNSNQDGNNDNSNEESPDEEPKDEVAQEALEIKDAWARASIPSSSNSAAYFQIINNTKKEYVLISASTSVANNVELHNSFVDEKGIGRMTTIDRVVIPANSTIEFKPGGMHVMLFNLKKIFKQGDKFSLDLIIENSDPIIVECEIKN